MATASATQAQEEKHVQWKGQESSEPTPSVTPLCTTDGELAFADLPPFPSDIPTAPLLRLSLSKLLAGSQEEEERLWRACCDLGFFYLDLRDDKDGGKGDERLLEDAARLFEVAKEVFDLPVAEKVKYDFKEKGSYYGYKGYGDGVIDKEGTKDRNEFYNTSKDDILNQTDPLPAPQLLQPHRPLFSSFIHHSHAIVTLVLSILNTQLGLPARTLQSKHRLSAVSGDQVRFVKAPAQPAEDRQTALGEHTDFGSVTVLFNRLGGLQVRLPGSGAWTFVQPLRGHAVVNLGDAVAKFTAGLLRSNIHRVVSPPGDQAAVARYSLVYFARPEDDVVLKRLRGSRLVDEKVAGAGGVAEEEEEEEVSSKEWILRRALGRRGVGAWEKSNGTEELSMRRGGTKA
ncbi:hypothetical protein B0A49_10173 [Cryomyces minteri]|uniref:Fe2OG dioxygenase domain-containing protein n=1 Tax=Cryomyces minteri TaxID=331657 RepID=A0A4U0X589_9PEZI|nr:hypothetical protein B0A49_10173 [Cryomyces minteri]